MIVTVTYSEYFIVPVYRMKSGARCRKQALAMTNKAQPHSQVLPVATRGIAAKKIPCGSKIIFPIDLHYKETPVKLLTEHLRLQTSSIMTLYH